MPFNTLPLGRAPLQTTHQAVVNVITWARGRHIGIQPSVIPDNTKPTVAAKWWPARARKCCNVSARGGNFQQSLWNSEAMLKCPPTGAEFASSRVFGCGEWAGAKLSSLKSSPIFRSYHPRTVVSHRRLGALCTQALTRLLPLLWPP